MLLKARRERAFLHLSFYRLLTVYDMCKAVDRGMTITDVKVMEKHGGKSRNWAAE